MVRPPKQRPVNVASPLSDSLPTRSNEADLPVHIGRFFILRRLGVGGMSQVLLGYDEDLDRKLAIKLLRADRSRDERDRMRREAQALAQLSHPNVVHVYEVGEYGDTLYLAMEYVNGETLGTYVDGRSVPEIVAAYLEAGRGLAAAHRAGLVHRDFKPPNAMVGRDGRVRVMDFGLARGQQAPREAAGAADPAAVPTRDPALWADMTQAGWVLGTPAYMAPEQWTGAPIDARTDQFAFCVALWEALYGERPFAGKTPKELQLNVLGGERREPPQGAKVASWLRRVLERGLSVDPGARYPTMEALLAALESGETRRRRTFVAAAVLGVVALGGAIAGGLSWREAQFFAECRAAGAEIEAVWSDAARAKIRDVFAAAAPQIGASTVAHVEPFVDRFAAAWQAARTHACVLARDDVRWGSDAAERADECLVEARESLESSLAVLAEADASTVQRAVQVVAELPQVAPCLDLARLARRPSLPDEETTRAGVLELRRALQEVRSLHAAGRYRDALTRGAALLPPADALGWAPLSAQARLVAASAAASVEDLRQAEGWLEQSLLLAAGVDDETQVADAATLLAEVVGNRMAHHAEGLRWGRFAQEMIASQGDAESLRGALILDILANIHHERGDYDQAEQLHKRALSLRARLLGPHHPDVARSLVSLGNIHTIRRQAAEARRVYAQALDIRQRAQGPEHPDVALTLNNLAVAYRSLGDYETAEQLNLRALAIRERVLGVDHPDVARSRSSLGAVYFERKQYAEAQRLYEQAQAALEKVLGRQHPSLAGLLTRLGDLYQRRGSLEQARRAYTRALAISEAAHGREHIDLAWPLLGLGQVELTRGRPADAARRLERALPLFEKSGLAVEVAEARFALARALWPKKRARAQARQLAEQAAETFAARGLSEREGEVAAWLAARDGEGPRKRG